jgi:hypothetical protein
VAVTVKVTAVEFVGVPDSTPVLAFKYSHEGSPEALYTTGSAVVPELVIVCAYGDPITGAASVVGFTTITGQTLIFSIWSLKQVFASIALTVTVVPFTPLVGTVGVPLMLPVLLMLKPSGHVPEDVLQV